MPMPKAIVATMTKPSSLGIGLVGGAHFLVEARVVSSAAKPACAKALAVSSTLRRDRR